MSAQVIWTCALTVRCRSGNGDKRGWIWVGGALGVLASIATAMA